MRIIRIRKHCALTAIKGISNMPGRRFGFELEFDSNRIGQSPLRESFATSLAEHDPDQCIRDREGMRTWTVKSDGSCGWEITSPALFASPKTFTTLRNVINGARRQIAGRRVIRRNCGFHVHVDINDLTKAQIVILMRIFHSFEKCFLKLHPGSRDGNGYCHKIAGDNRNSNRMYNNFDPDDYNQSRHYNHLFDHSTGISFSRFSERGTIEIRYGGGTIRATKIVNWIKVILYCIEISKSLEDFETLNTESIEDLCDFIKHNPTKLRWMERHKPRVIQWIISRARQLAAA